MEKHPIIKLIGAGTMAEALIAGILNQKLTTPKNIIASDPRLERGKELENTYGITTTPDNQQAIEKADIVVLAVKPQILEKVMEGLKNTLKENTLVLSIVAGASIKNIREGLGHPNIIRSMPNTPAQIGKGITVWTTSDVVTEEQKDMAQHLLSALGEEIFVNEENYLDMATALSGSGPAYIFLFMEAMIDAGVHLGFPRRISEKLVTQTFRGSAEYFNNKKDHVAQLRNEVTSPGGTTAAALYYLEKAGIRTAISRAIWAAYERSQELGKGKKGKSPEK